ncbi:MAG: branched-chain amino acid ABC transporter permease [Thermoleophilia bacterium]|nr:branched-chain amino acid ABC transporter permease [Thermoleophilia bacterium]
MSVILQLAFDGLTIGLIYVILAAGLVLILSVTEIFFVAYGQFYMWGAYVTWYIVDRFNLNYFLGLLTAIAATMVFGLGSYLLIFRRMQRTENRFLVTVTGALGISLILAQAVLVVFGTQPKSIPGVFKGAFDIGQVHFEVKKLALIGMGVLVTLALFLIYERTKLGRAMRAVALDADTAALYGINPTRIYLLTMGIGCALAGLAGGLLAPAYNLSSGMGNNVIASVLLMTMLGGMDSLLGAVVGGLIVGQILSFGQYYTGQMSVVYLFLFIGLVIYFRPNGLLGRRTDMGM